MQHARSRITARVVAVLRQPAVALFPVLDEPVPAHRRVQQGFRFVLEAIVHAVREGEQQVVQTARGPVRRGDSWTTGRHDAPVVGALAVVLVVLHTFRKKEYIENGEVEKSEW